MRTHFRRLAMLLVAGAMLVPAATAAQTVPDYRQLPANEWPTVGGNWANQRYSTLSQINSSNIDKLGGAWMARLDGSGFDKKYSQQGTPVVQNGVMYVPTGQQDVFAVNAKTGETIWEYRADVDPKSPGGWNNRGVAVADGKVFTIRKDGGVVALDQKTGKQVWNADISPDLAPAEKYLSNALIYFDGMILTGLSGGDAGVRGRLSALDAKTGAELWRFYTVPGPGDANFGTWEGDSWIHGGAAMWMHSAIDPDLGMLYTPTGNAWPADDASVRGGDNLYTASIVALDVHTGEYKWHFQEVHHEFWDYDNDNSPVLFDTVIDGQPRKGLAHAGKTGWLYLLDRTNGKPLVGINETPVKQDARQKTAATQPIPVGDPFTPQCATDPIAGYAVGCMFDPFFEDPILMPGVLGGSDYAPISYSPQTGLIYVSGTIINYAFTIKRETILDTGKRQILEGLGHFLPNGTKRSGNLTAMDPKTNKIVWQKPLDYPAGLGSGVMSTAGGLLFHGSPDGNLMAFDANTGNLVWQFQTGFGADGPPITYQIDGEQYVAIATGGNNIALSARGDAVWAFKLGGTLRPLNPPPAPPRVQAITTEPVPVSSVSIGKQWDVRPMALFKNEYSFGPDSVSVAPGTTVTWTNDGDIAHTVTSQDGLFESGLLQSGQDFQFTFDKPGTYSYFCTPHPWMLGQVIVK